MTLDKTISCNQIINERLNLNTGVVVIMDLRLPGSI
jgi:hypothetical protein